jgi:hypothetical protein
MATGVYRTKTLESGAECAVVDYAPSPMGEITRAQYKQRGCDPPFDKLPTKEMHQPPSQ